ncbi:pirin family protein [Halioglobus maricola]|uniref:Pirin family protein n=1 Tax=Halioglobus maricola TaxID=2601894 RepID=A0A5P9NIM1_9GAMM|nr:pirin family protein [Halioglobus maricola]QFU75395.1 pirin family protein [Halioglobus maricola]
MKIVQAQHTLEGAGFSVARPIPMPACESVGPFILLDHIGPLVAPAGQSVAAPTHPHAGIETISYFLDGEGFHQDSLGNKATTGPGEVQWMRAGRGIVHDEAPGKSLVEHGGRVHAVQLWLNMPGASKSAEPVYKSFRQADIPKQAEVSGLEISVIAGQYTGLTGPLTTFAEPLLMHVALEAKTSTCLELPGIEELGVFTLEGSVTINGNTVAANELAVMSESERNLQIACTSDCELLILGGPAVRDELVRYGPFVANSAVEMQETIERYRQNLFGEL